MNILDLNAFLLELESELPEVVHLIWDGPYRYAVRADLDGVEFRLRRWVSKDHLAAVRWAKLPVFKHTRKEILAGQVRAALDWIMESDEPGFLETL